MSGLEYIIGAPISRFPENRLPTIRDMLCFYSQYWGMHGSDSIKESRVAEELIKLYQRKNIVILDKKTIKNQINKVVANLKTILKFKTKIKTATNILKETMFRSMLNEIFDIRREFRTINEYIGENATDDIPMEVDDPEDMDTSYESFESNQEENCGM